MTRERLHKWFDCSSAMVPGRLIVPPFIYNVYIVSLHILHLGKRARSRWKYEEKHHEIPRSCPSLRIVSLSELFKDQHFARIQLPFIFTCFHSCGSFIPASLQLLVADKPQSNIPVQWSHFQYLVHRYIYIYTFHTGRVYLMCCFKEVLKDVEGYCISCNFIKRALLVLQDLYRFLLQQHVHEHSSGSHWGHLAFSQSRWIFHLKWAGLADAFLSCFYLPDCGTEDEKRASGEETQVHRQPRNKRNVRGLRCNGKEPVNHIKGHEREDIAEWVPLTASHHDKPLWQVCYFN